MKTGPDMPGEQYVCCSNCHCPVNIPDQQCPVSMTGLPRLLPTAPALPQCMPT